MKNIIFVALLFSGIYGSSQSIATRNMIWATHYGEYKFNPKISAAVDAQFRYEYTDRDIFQWFVRPSVTFNNKGWLLTAGGAYFFLYPNPNGLQPRHEIRPWEEISRKWIFKDKHTIQPRVRLEQRFIREYEGVQLAQQYSWNSLRVRTRFDYSAQLQNFANGKWYFIAGIETFFQWKKNGFSSFDQNRTWTGIGYKFNPSLSTHLTYLNVIVQNNSNSHTVFHVIRPGITYSLSKKQEEKK